MKIVGPRWSEILLGHEGKIITMARFTRQTRRNDSKIAGMYDLEERLGAGHFAEVKLARHVFTGERVAVKVIDKLKLDDMAKHHLFQEVRCMKLVQHPNIVRLYEVIDTNTKLYLVQELGDGGDMYDYIMKHERGLSEEKARRYFRQILQAIDYCHKLYVVHRDLKPENVIFFKKFDVAKLTDFGFSNKFMPGKKLETACGSLAYSAPEILLGDSYDAPAVDVWSLGVILYMMVVGKAPFYEANESETLTMILDCKFHIPDHVSPTCKSLISRMIVRDASKRASLEDIMSDPWILQDNGPILVTTVPLANQVRLGVDQHNEVVQKMQLGDIADQETIKKCLESGSYNHVSATYYLLAEQILRRLPWHKSLSSSSLSSQGGEAKSHVPKRAIGLPSDVEQTSLGIAQATSTDCPVDGTSVEELPCDEPGMNPDEPGIIEIDTNLLSSRLTYHSSESIYDKFQSSADEQHNEEEIVGAVSVSMTNKQRQTFQKKRVSKVKSTPAFLNQISEERESDLDDSPRASPRVRRPSRRPLDVLKAQQKNRRPSPASSSGGRRSSSVSSSSEEDGDLDKKMSWLSTDRCRRSPKRRSDDEGDGDDGEGGTRSPSGVARKKKMSDNSQTRSQEPSAEPGNKSDVRGKCANIHFPAAVLKDRLIEVNLKLEIHKIDSGRNESHPMDSSDPSGMNSSDFSGRIMDRSGTEECENVNLNEGISSIRMATNDDKSDGLLEDGITKDTIVGDGLVEGGIVEDEIMEGGIVKDGIVKDGLVKDGPEKDGIVKDGLVKDGIVRDGIVRVGIVWDGLVKDGIVKDGIERDGIVRDGIVEDLMVENGVTKTELTDDDNAEKRIVDDGNLTKSGPTEDSTVKNRIVEDGILDIFQGGNNENTSDKENVNYSRNCETFVDFSEQDDCPQDDIPKVTFRGSDIDEIEMYMKAKDTGLELDTVAVRTIFNNRKVSQVTSNCCQII